MKILLLAIIASGAIFNLILSANTFDYHDFLSEAKKNNEAALKYLKNLNTTSLKDYEFSRIFEVLAETPNLPQEILRETDTTAEFWRTKLISHNKSSLLMALLRYANVLDITVIKKLLEQPNNIDLDQSYGITGDTDALAPQTVLEMYESRIANRKEIKNPEIVHLLTPVSFQSSLSEFTESLSALSSFFPKSDDEFGPGLWD